MSNPTKENIATVMNGFAEFFNRMTQTQNFNLKEFVNFMEPKFKAAGYRENIIYNARNVAEGGVGNILILTEVAAGDFVVSTSAIREIRRLYPNAHITLLVSPSAFELAECCPYVDEIISDYQKPISSLNNLPELYQLNMRILPKILSQRLDICFALAIHTHTSFLMYMSGAKVRFTSPYYSGPLIALSNIHFPYNTCGYHLVDNFLSVVENILQLPITNRKLEVWYTPADIGIAREYLKNISGKIYALSFGGTGLKKHYPPEKYAQLLEMILSEEPATTFVILGGGQDDLNSAEIIKTVAPTIYENHIIDLTDKINYRQSAAVTALCDMYIGNDTGTMHVATAVDIPVLTPNCFPADLPILNRDIPSIFYPYGVPSVVVQPKHALPECKNPKAHPTYGCAAEFPHCIAQIEPETLFKGFKLLKERAAKKINEPLYIH